MRILIAYMLAACSCAGATVFAPACAQTLFDGERMPYEAFDKLALTPVTIGTATLNVGFAPGEFALAKERLLWWIRQSANAVSVYYGRFPVTSARVLIVPGTGRGVRGGKAYGYRGGAIRLVVGRDSTEADLLRDWQAVHEMVHLATPSLAQRHLWLTEGLAVYIESIARARAGDRSAEDIWLEFVRDMPNGLPLAGDRGLDQTPTWGRTYWGGAIFCLLADVEIRKRTGNQKGLEQAMRAVIAAGGSNEFSWPIGKVLAIADAAVGTPVMSELYQQMGASPYAPNLSTLWSELGISVRGGRVAFDDRAIMAPIRRAITATPAEKGPVAN